MCKAGVVKVQMSEKQAGQLLRLEASDLSTIRRSARLRVSPKARATVDNVRLTVDDDRDGDSAVTCVRCRRPAAENDDLGYVGRRIVPPIRLAERRPFLAAGSRVGFDYVLGEFLAFLSLGIGDGWLVLRVDPPLLRVGRRSPCRTRQACRTQPCSRTGNRSPGAGSSGLSCDSPSMCS